MRDYRGYRCEAIRRSGGRCPNRPSVTKYREMENMDTGETKVIKVLVCGTHANVIERGVRTRVFSGGWMLARKEQP